MLREPIKHDRRDYYLGDNPSNKFRIKKKAFWSFIFICKKQLKVAKDGQAVPTFHGVSEVRLQIQTTMANNSKEKILKNLT